MTKKAEPGISLSSFGDEHEHRVFEATTSPISTDMLLWASNSSLVDVLVHNSNKTKNEREALWLIHKYFVQRKGSTQHYLAQFILESGQTLTEFDTFMYCNENNLFFAAPLRAPMPMASTGSIKKPALYACGAPRA